jgi:hypothetical protein
MLERCFLVVGFRESSLVVGWLKVCCSTILDIVGTGFRVTLEVYADCAIDP